MATYYVVKDNEHKELDRLVIAPSNAQAVKHCAKRYTAKAADTHTVAKMIQAGVTVETAGVAVDPADAQQAGLRG